MSADLATMQMMITAMTAAMAFAVLLVAVGTRPSEGLRALGAGLLLTALSFAAYGLLILSEDPWARRLGALLGNLLLGAALAASYVAISQFRRTAPRRRVILLPLLLIGALSLTVRNPVLRSGLCGLIFAGQALLVAHAAARVTPPARIERGAVLFAIGTFGIGLLYLARTGVLLLGTSAPDDLLSPNALNTASLVAGQVSIVLSTLGFLLMPFERRAIRYRQQAGTDALTRIANRRGLAATFDALLGQAASERAPVAVLMLDLDHFKRLNDTYGHSAGDAFLSAVANTLRRHLRAEDLLARYGGEEFLVVLPRTRQEDALKVAQYLREAIAELGVPWRNETLMATASIGLAARIPEGPGNRLALIEAADRALYAAKDKGRNRVEIAPGEAREAAGTAPSIAC
jgi:diguanylate cyclase (GGDEF)-like protein